MTDHIIKVTLSPTGRKLTPIANQNRLEVDANDRVTWDLPEQAMQVNFLAFVPSQPRLGTNQGNHPFTVLPQPTAQNSIGAAAEDGLYLYTISDSQGHVLPWETSLFTVGSFSAFLASIIKPMGPP